ncbi:uncharacterized protein LOC127834211 [Dreissena polymorpha]|uniref:uncharacterized protein LOC127834211 n=1 Tax=Dreissena polymorpha TaxID=45954 RepID=UPI00226549C4|nr:uncharacterized protein LOC127834211 [Dreissena polymorpha]
MAYCWPVAPMTLVIPQPKQDRLKLFKIYHTISVIKHPIKVMLGIILNRLKSQAEEPLTEEQAGFRAGRSTLEQICHCSVIIKKLLRHQRELFNTFIDLKKACNRVWYCGIWHVMRGFNIDKEMMQAANTLRKR